MKPRLLVVEDDPSLGAMLVDELVDEGFDVELVVNGRDALARLRERAHDACVLDIALPGLDGFSVLREARGAGVTTPVVLLTARDAVDDRVRGFELGGDDYVVKPFAFAELLARVRARLRRPQGPQTVLKSDGVVVDVNAHRVEVDGVETALTAREFAFLAYLLRQPDEVVSRRMILEDVFGYRFDPGTNIVDVHVAHLRKKIDRAGTDSLIETVRGVGYRWRRRAAR
jgi:DNA-binding response OmpR family regulator